MKYVAVSEHISANICACVYNIMSDWPRGQWAHFLLKTKKSKTTSVKNNLKLKHIIISLKQRLLIFVSFDVKQNNRHLVWCIILHVIFYSYVHKSLHTDVCKSHCALLFIFCRFQEAQWCDSEVRSVQNVVQWASLPDRYKLCSYPDNKRHLLKI